MTDLKLLALDSEDLEVISATTQDAVIRVGDMGFARADRRFALLMNRFAWEDGEAAARRKGGVRKRTALHFDHVTEVRTSGFDPNANDGVVELLSITFSATDAPSGTIELVFAGGGTLRLEVEAIEARLRDLGAAWATPTKPGHAA